MKYKNLLILTALALISSFCFADYYQDNAGEYGFKFLNNPVNPVSLALAGRTGSVSLNPAAFVIQPALSSTERTRAVGLTQTSWIGDTDIKNIYYVNSDRNRSYGLILRSLDYGSIDKYDEFGNFTGTYSPLDIGLTTSFGKRLSPSNYVGANIGVVYEELSTASGLGVSADLGYTWIPPIMNSTLSISLRNLGFCTKMNDTTIKLAPAVEVDLGKTYTLEATSIRLALSATRAIDEQLKGTFSTEVGLFDMLYLRMGYKVNYSAADISAGLGFRYNRFSVDYGWAPYDNSLGDVHSIGLSYNF